MNRTDYCRQQEDLKRKTKNFGRQIFKLQRPQAGHAVEANLILIYNKDRSIWGEVQATKELLKLFGQDQKVFYFGRYRPDTKIEFMERAPWQDW